MNAFCDLFSFAVLCAANECDEKKLLSAYADSRFFDCEKREREMLTAAGRG